MAGNPNEKDSIGDLAHAIYEANIRHLVEPDHHGEYLILDVVSGEYEIDADGLAANFRMLERYPAETLVTLRIGYPAYGTFGFRAPRPAGDTSGTAKRQRSQTPADHADEGDAVVDRAYAIYEAEIRYLVEPERHGDYLTLDVATGDYEIDADDMAANTRMLERYSPATLVTMRIGYPAFGTFVGWRDLMP